VFDSRQKQKVFFFFSVTFRLDMEPTQRPRQSLPGAVSSGLKWKGRETNHSHPSIAEVKNGVAVPPLPRTSS
jgi:hypothetical protein